MIEDRTLMRVWVRSAPDGQSVQQAEYANVQIRWPAGGEPQGGMPNSYAFCGDWRLLPPHIMEGKRADDSAQRLALLERHLEQHGFPREGPMRALANGDPILPEHQI